jgi:hypothetical protein
VRQIPQRRHRTAYHAARESALRLRSYQLRSPQRSATRNPANNNAQESIRKSASGLVPDRRTIRATAHPIMPTTANTLHRSSNLLRAEYRSGDIERLTVRRANRRYTCGHIPTSYQLEIQSGNGSPEALRQP